MYITLKSFTNEVALKKLLHVVANMTFENEIGHIVEESKRNLKTVVDYINYVTNFSL